MISTHSGVWLAAGLGASTQEPLIPNSNRRITKIASGLNPYHSKTGISAALWMDEKAVINNALSR